MHNARGAPGGPRERADLDELDASLAMHDDLIALRGVEIWIGAEPTFTRADSLEPAWTGAASGNDKLARAHALAIELGARLPGAAVSRVVGRQFPDEAEPRFAFGVRWRDGAGNETSETPSPSGADAMANRTAVHARTDGASTMLVAAVFATMPR
jgi:uncharacterized protein (DUF2126 family)